MLLALGLLLGLSGCGGPPMSPSEHALKRARSASLRALSRAESAVAAEAPYRLRLRMNSAPCAAPHHEVHFFGGWHRVYLGGPNELLQRLERMPEGQTLWVKAQASGKSKRAPSGQLFSILNVEVIEVD